MKRRTHINVTVRFSALMENVIDLRIPVHQPVRELITNLLETLKIPYDATASFALKVMTKQLVLTDDDKLDDYPVTDGDMLFIFTK